MLCKIAGVVRPLSICKCHDKHVATFLKRLLLIISERMACGIWIVAAKIMHRVLVGVLARLLILEKRVQKKFQEHRIGVDEDGVQREDDVYGLRIAIRADLFDKEIRLTWSTAKLGGTESLPGCK